MSETAHERDPAQPSGNKPVDDQADAFAILARPSNVDSIADQLKKELTNQGETLESLLRTLREIRDDSASADVSS